MKFLIASSLVAVSALSLLVRVESLPFDMAKMGQEAMNLAQTGMQVMQSFKPEDIQEIMVALKKPEEREGLMKVLVMFVQGKPLSEIGDYLLDLECGPTIAQAILPLIEKYKDFKDKYGAGIKEIAEKGK